MKAHEKLIEYRNKYVNRPDEKINIEYLSMIDSVLDEYNYLKRKLEEYEKNAHFFRQFETTYLSRETMRDIENMQLELKDWLFSLYKYSMYNDRYFLEPKKKAEEIEMLIDLMSHFEFKITCIVDNFNYLQLFWNLIYTNIKSLPIEKQIIETCNNKTLNRIYDLSDLFKKKYNKSFSLCNSKDEIKQVLRNDYQTYLFKYIENIRELHTKLIPKKICCKTMITNDGKYIIEKPKIVMLDFSEKPTKLGYLIDNLFNMPDEVLNNDEWWQDLFYKELAI